MKLGKITRIEWIALPILLIFSVPVIAAQFTVAEDTGEHLGYINLVGKIERNDGLEFRKVAQSLIARGNTIHQVILCTSGGDVEAAMDIGNQIKVLQASTVGPNQFANAPQGEIQCWPKTQYGSPVILKYNALSQQGDQNANCASACFLIWSSGVTRDGNYIGVHRFYFNASIYRNLSPLDAKKLYESAMDRYRQFLVERNVPTSIIEKTFVTESISMYYLNTDELKLMQSVPYLEEFYRARCGELRDIKEFDAYGNWRSTTYDNNWRACARRILKEMEISGVKAYSGDDVPSVRSDGPQINPPITPVTPPNTISRSSGSPAELKMSRWTFNGSGMYMTANGKRRRVFYETPRESLDSLGISSGSLIFDGDLNGARFTGSVMAYAPGCAVLKYPVSGILNPDGLSFNLVGRRPARDDWCNVVGSTDVTLIFEYVR
ncbi:hypothetical protein [Methylocystis sp.]|uniref:hypothetical protein n=1 Tax=Methylocystis sp. TaxID=1911079 RepID=UPI003DA44D46